MKHITLILSIIMLVGNLAAQAPQGINYQAVARNTDTSPKANTALTVGIKIKDALGAELYTEFHNATTNGLGLFNLTIGQGSNPSTPFANIPWATGSKLLEVIINGQSGGTQPLLSVPYALYAEKTKLEAGNSGISVSGNIISNTGDLSNTNEIQTLSVSGSSLTLSNGGGTVNLPSPPAYVPDIAMFEERKQNGVAGGTSLNGAFNTRILNTTVKASPSVSLDINSGFMTFVAGTYIITASAPAIQSDRHKLCLRTNNDVIVLRGTSELSNDTDATTTRSFIQGVLNVPNDGTTFKLDHFIDSNTGGAGQLGAPTVQVPGQETYAQIMIQKIQ